MPFDDDFGYSDRADFLAAGAHDMIEDFDQDDVDAVVAAYDERQTGARLY